MGKIIQFAADGRCGELYYVVLRIVISVTAIRFGKIRKTFIMSDSPKRKLMEIFPAAAPQRQKIILYTAGDSLPSLR